MTDFKKAMTNPAEHFASPQQVVDDQGLSTEQKIAILRQWEYDSLQRAVATEENMAPPGSGGAIALADIRKALEALGVTGGADTGGTKFG